MNSELKPKIRFKGFTDDWEQRKLGDECFELIAGGDIDKTRSVNNGKYPIYANALTNDGIVGYYNDSYRVKSPAVTITGRGEIGYAMARNTDFTPVVRLISLRSKHNNYFLANAINLLNVVSESTGVPQLTIPQVEKFDIYFPKNINEEIKLGRLFNEIDNLITLHQRKCDKLVELKKSLLEKMFPQNNSVIPEIRFKGFTNDWEQRKLDDFGKSTGGTSIESEFEENGIYKVISIGSYSESSKYNDQGIRCKSSEKTLSKLLNKDDLTMILNDKTASGNIIGRVLLIDKSEEYVYNQRTERIEPNTKDYYPQFLYHMLNAPNIRKKIIKQSQGNTQIFVNWTGIQNLEYLVPTMDEQINLAKLIGNLDNLITLHQCKYDKLNKIRQSLLNDMFI